MAAENHLQTMVLEDHSLYWKQWLGSSKNHNSMHLTIESIIANVPVSVSLLGLVQTCFCDLHTLQERLLSKLERDCRKLQIRICYVKYWNKRETWLVILKRSSRHVIQTLSPDNMFVATKKRSLQLIHVSRPFHCHWDPTFAWRTCISLS